MRVKEFLQTFSRNIISILTGLETYRSPYAKTVGEAADIADVLIRKASIKTSTIASVVSISPFNLAGILPELLSIYAIQGRLIKDIAHLYGKEKTLDKEVIFYCLFKHNNLKILHKTIEDTGERIIIRTLNQDALHKLLQKVGYNASKTLLRKSFTRLFPIIGTAFLGFASYQSTKNVGKTAKDIFSRDILIEYDNPSTEVDNFVI